MCKIVSTSGEYQEHMVLTLGDDKKPSWRHIEGTTMDNIPFTLWQRESVSMGFCIMAFGLQQI